MNSSYISSYSRSSSVNASVDGIAPYTADYTRRVAKIQEQREQTLIRKQKDVISSRSGGDSFHIYSADKSKSHFSDRTFGLVRPMSTGRSRDRDYDNVRRSRSASTGRSSQFRSASAEKSRINDSQILYSSMNRSSTNFDRELQVQRNEAAVEKQKQALLQVKKESYMNFLKGKGNTPWVPGGNGAKHATSMHKSVNKSAIDQGMVRKAWCRSPWPTSLSATADDDSRKSRNSSVTDISSMNESSRNRRYTRPTVSPQRVSNTRQAHSHYGNMDSGNDVRPRSGSSSSSRRKSSRSKEIGTTSSRIEPRGGDSDSFQQRYATITPSMHSNVSVSNTSQSQAPSAMATSASISKASKYIALTVRIIDLANVAQKSSYGVFIVPRNCSRLDLIANAERQFNVFDRISDISITYRSGYSRSVTIKSLSMGTLDDVPELSDYSSITIYLGGNTTYDGKGHITTTTIGGGGARGESNEGETASVGGNQLDASGLNDGDHLLYYDDDASVSVSAAASSYNTHRGVGVGVGVGTEDVNDDDQHSVPSMASSTYRSTTSLYQTLHPEQPMHGFSSPAKYLISDTSIQQHASSVKNENNMANSFHNLESHSSSNNRAPEMTIGDLIGDMNVVGSSAQASASQSPNTYRTRSFQEEDLKLPKSMKPHEFQDPEIYKYDESLEGLILDDDVDLRNDSHGTLGSQVHNDDDNNKNNNKTKNVTSTQEEAAKRKQSRNGSGRDDNAKTNRNDTKAVVASSQVPKTSAELYMFHESSSSPSQTVQTGTGGSSMATAGAAAASVDSSEAVRRVSTVYEGEEEGEEDIGFLRESRDNDQEDALPSEYTTSKHSENGVAPTGPHANRDATGTTPSPILPQPPSALALVGAAAQKEGEEEEEEEEEGGGGGGGGGAPPPPPIPLQHNEISPIEQPVPTSLPNRSAASILFQKGFEVQEADNDQDIVRQNDTTNASNGDEFNNLSWDQELSEATSVVEKSRNSFAISRQQPMMQLSVDTRDDADRQHQRHQQAHVEAKEKNPPEQQQEGDQQDADQEGQSGKWGRFTAERARRRSTLSSPRGVFVPDAHEKPLVDHTGIQVRHTNSSQGRGSFISDRRSPVRTKKANTFASSPTSRLHSYDSNDPAPRTVDGEASPKNSAEAENAGARESKYIQSWDREMSGLTSQSRQSSGQLETPLSRQSSFQSNSKKDAGLERERVLRRDSSLRTVDTTTGTVTSSVSVSGRHTAERARRRSTLSAPRGVFVADAHKTALVDHVGIPVRHTASSRGRGSFVSDTRAHAAHQQLTLARLKQKSKDSVVPRRKIHMPSSAGGDYDDGEEEDGDASTTQNDNEEEEGGDAPMLVYTLRRWHSGDIPVQGDGIEGVPSSSSPSTRRQSSFRNVSNNGSTAINGNKSNSQSASPANRSPNKTTAIVPSPAPDRRPTFQGQQASLQLNERSRSKGQLNWTLDDLVSST